MQVAVGVRGWHDDGVGLMRGRGPVRHAFFRTDFLVLDVIRWASGKVCPAGSFLGAVRNIRLGTRKSGNVLKKGIVGHPCLNPIIHTVAVVVDGFSC